jgi:hypothetical protein
VRFARELAFALEEARELLVDREGVALDDGDVALLLERTSTGRFAGACNGAWSSARERADDSDLPAIARRHQRRRCS